MKEGDGLALASCTCQGQVWNIWLAIPVMGLALFERSFELAHHMQVENISDSRVIGCVMLHFKPSTFIRRSAENS